MMWTVPVVAQVQHPQLLHLTNLIGKKFQLVGAQGHHRYVFTAPNLQERKAKGVGRATLTKRVITDSFCQEVSGFVLSDKWQKSRIQSENYSLPLSVTPGTCHGLPALPSNVSLPPSHPSADLLRLLGYC